LAAAWLQVFAPPLHDFDAFVVLRKEAVPYSEHLMGCQLSAWKAVQGQLEAGGGRNSSSSSGSKKRGRAEEAAAAGGGEGDAPPKQARAVLKAFPQQLLTEAPTEQLVQELLVGFDPVKLYVQALTERYGHLAIFCCDSTAGLPVVAIKWRPDAFLPQLLRPALAQGSLQLSLTTLDAVRGGVGKPGARTGLIVPNMPQVLHEIQLMGLGLVQRVLLKAQ
jgi:U3 small nucleolar RNA-associated protein 22